MQVVVCGSRTYTNKDLVYELLDVCQPTEIVHGGSKGADTIAQQYADDHDIECTVFRAEWDVYGRGAGPVRNKKMLEYSNPDCVVLAFGSSAGTSNTLALARKMKRSVFVAEE